MDSKQEHVNISLSMNNLMPKQRLVWMLYRRNLSIAEIIAKTKLTMEQVIEVISLHRESNKVT
jgi:hypothetical protein